MKRVLIFSLAYFPSYVGGAEVAIKEITDRIDPADYEFHMITLRFDSSLPRRERLGNVTVHRIGFAVRGATIRELGKFPLFLNKYLLPFAGFFTALKLHRLHRFDAVWNMMANHAAFAGLFFKLWDKNVKYILTLQEGDPIHYIRGRVRFIYPLFNKIFTAADFIQTISAYLARWARSEGYSGELAVIPNGVDIERFSRNFSDEELEESKKELGKRPEDIFLVTASRLVKKNALDDVIKALQYLPANVCFAIMGIGTEEEALRTLAERLGFSRRVKFLGQISHEEMPKYLKACDIFVRPSLSEGMGNSFIEAMAAGLPVIATQEGGIADFLFDPDRNPDKVSTGRAVDVNDPEDIARAVRLFLENKEMTAKIVRNAQKLASEKYDWKLIAEDMRSKVFGAILGN